MFCRGVSWLTCILVAVVIATDYNGTDSITESNHEVTAHQLRTDSPELSTAEGDQDVKETTATDLASLLGAGDGAILTLVAGDMRLAAHRAVLVARSPVFAAMFQHETLDPSSHQVTITDVEGQVLREMLTYMYSLQVPQLPSMASKMLVAADRYGLSALKAALEQQVAAQLSVENAAATALLALRHSCPSLLRAAVTFIKGRTHQVVMTQGWADATVSQPLSIVELTRLIAEPTAETSASPAATAEGGRTPGPHQQPHSDHARPPAAAALPTAACRTPPPDEATVSRLRSLSREEKGKRLIKAAMVGAVGELQALLAAGADVGTTDEAWNNWTALHWAADRGHLEMVRCLLEVGADVEARTSRKNTALHLAAWSGHTAVVRLLAASGTDVNTRGESGGTPLHFAVQWGQAQTAFALLAAGADRGAKDKKYNATPLDFARLYMRQQLQQMLSPR